MNVPEKHRAVAHAWVDGAEIEMRHEIGTLGAWKECTEPTWSSVYEYRIKPKPKVKKWHWAYCVNGPTFISPHATEQVAISTYGPDAIKLPWTEIEVEE